MRLSLFAGLGAVGWITLGAAGASAAEEPSALGLAGSVSGVVDSVSTPAASAVSALTSPLQAVTVEVLPEPGTAGPLLDAEPSLSEVVAHVPQLVTQPAGTVLPPVTSRVDGVVSQVPIVQTLVPAGTVTDVTSPVVGAVDGAAGVITAPVLDVVAPVTEVIEPVLEIVTPVAEVLDPVVGLVPPVSGVLDPVVGLVPPVSDAGPSGAVADPASAGANGSVPSAPASPVDPAETKDSDPAAARGSAGAEAVVGVKRSRAAEGLESLGVLREAFEPAVSLGGVLPALAGAVSIAHGEPDLPGAPFTASVTFGGALSSMTGAGTGAPLAALGGLALLMFMMLSGKARRSASADLPAGPSYDPGSSPD
ncbi:hypothetical protein FDK12_07110 [Arthrobacter sp. NamB2]|uniref:hypothetical protein n=1 Tax=Arthrobacter sp. NamB2 TaxID=2576035 RepID=UPI00113AA8C1|nr:hypothetical protein [Arthrobacter sp. NamB2]TKV28428.1 hypothetical protein FDK12_07110 [Arthrobacter sp. NamB2]